MNAQTQRKAEFTTPSDRQIRIERVFDAPRERVFEAYTKPELIEQWWGSNTKVEEMDVKPGGAWHFVTENGEGQGFKGTYREVEAPERLSYSFEWEGMPGHVLIETLSFEQFEGGTKLVNVSTFHFTEERDGMLNSGMEAGANASLARLDELLANWDD